MQKSQISYAELAKKVGDMVLFNSHNDVDEFWYNGLIEQPLMTERLEELNEENRQYEIERIAQSTDESEKAKLSEELEDMEQTSVYDMCESIYQTFAITPEGARYLFNHTAEVISYSEKLGLYFWHISHYGTSWSGVYTTVTDWEYNESPEWYAYSEEEIDKYIIG